MSVNRDWLTLRSLNDRMLPENEICIRRLVWSQTRYVKDPDAGKRASTLNPENELTIQDVPERRLVDQEVWHAVRAHEDARPQRPCLKTRPFAGTGGARAVCYVDAF